MTLHGSSHSGSDSSDVTRVREVLSDFKSVPGALLPVLHAVQEVLGFVPREVVPIIAEALNLSRAEVHGVISFYHFFRPVAPGQRILQVCRGEACQAMGSDKLIAFAMHRVGAQLHTTSADGRFSLEAVYCLGNCACAPSVMVDRKVHGRMSRERLEELLFVRDEDSV